MTTITPSARPNIAPSEERVKELIEWAEKTLELHRLRCDLAATWGVNDTVAEADLLAILDDYSALKAEVKRLNTWHSTLSEAWKARAEKSEAENERLKTALWDALKNRPIKVTVEPEGATDLLERLRKAEAELKVAGGTIEEIVKAWCLDKAELAKQAPLIEAVNKWDGRVTDWASIKPLIQAVDVYRAAKAEAELVLEKMLTADLTRDVNEAHTQLAKQAPLIEAVMGANLFPAPTDGRTCIDSHDKIIRAALALREGEGK